MTRHLLLAGLLLGACEPQLPYTPPAAIVTAVFDPTNAKIPLPNDLAFINPPDSTCPPPANTLPATSPPACAQAELLAAFNGFFPSDQEVAVTIDFTETTFDGSGNQTQSAPDLDLTSFTPSTFFVYGSNDAGIGEVRTDPIQAADYVKSADHGTLTIHHAGRQPWAPGSYAVLIRGGENGIETTDKQPVYASQIFDLLAQGLDLTDPKNNGLLKAQLGSTEAALEQGAQLNLLIGIFKQLAFPAADTRFPHQELAITATFKIAPTVTNVEIDPARGLVPLPIDLLRDPTSGKLSALAACTLAGSTLAADGTCPSSAASGFEALDGFSTTGAILAPTSELIDATTITPASLLLFDLTDPAHPAPVDANDLILEPCEFTSGCGSPTALSPVIAIQPAGATAGDATSVFRTRPLKDSTDYAVVMTTAILDKAGNAIGPGTVAKILHFTNPIVVGGHSALSGIDDVTAASLEKMRLQLQPVFSTLAGSGIDFSKVGIAYTFHTQTILSQANQLAAIPYTLPAATAMPVGAVNAMTPAAAFAKYGVDPVVVPSSHIDQVLEIDIDTVDGLSSLTGAFLANPAEGTVEQIHVLIATPFAGNANVPACPAALSPLVCAPMMVFRHGLGGGRGDMLTVADSNAAAGMVTVAIDAAKHGDRAFCTPGQPGQCLGGGACTTMLPSGAQGDVNPPGTCGAAGYATHPVSPSCTGACATQSNTNGTGISLVSGNYLVSTNFFRTRDTMRQDLIDESQLIRAIAFVPTTGVPTGHPVFDYMAGRGVVIDPATIFYSGQSLGAIQGAADVATNPRISKAGFNVGGGSVVDIFTNSPAFVSTTDQLLAGLGITPGTSAYLQFLVVAKTVLDPADPVNFVGHLTANTLPNLLVAGNPAQAAKQVLTQIANCDQTVPNPFELIYASNIPTGPLPTGPSFFGGGTGTFQLFVTDPFDPTTFGSCSPLPASAVEHAFLTDWVTPAITLNAQNDMAGFVMHGTAPLSVQHQ